MEPDSKLPSDNNIPSFFSNNDKNIKKLSHKKNDVQIIHLNLHQKNRGEHLIELFIGHHLELGLELPLLVFFVLYY